MTTNVTEALIRNLNKCVYDLTYNEYSDRYSSSSYSEGIEKAEIELRILCKIVNDCGLSNSVPYKLSGYLGISVNLIRFGLDVEDVEYDDEY